MNLIVIIILVSLLFLQGIVSLVCIVEPTLFNSRILGCIMLPFSFIIGFIIVLAYKREQPKSQPKHEQIHDKDIDIELVSNTPMKPSKKMQTDSHNIHEPSDGTNEMSRLNTDTDNDAESKIDELQHKHDSIKGKYENLQKELNKMTEAYNELTLENEELKSQNEGLTSQNEELQSKKEQENELIIKINELKSKKDEYELKMQSQNSKIGELAQRNKSLNSQIEELTNTIDTQNSTQNASESVTIDTVESKVATVDAINELKELKKQYDKVCDDLAKSQQIILTMQGVVNTTQKFPTVQETIAKYNSIRSQNHVNTCSDLTKFLKNNPGIKEQGIQKNWIKQNIHKFMFDTLMKCYSYMKEYKQYIFNEISDILNMKECIKKVQFDGQDTDSIDVEANKLLNNMFGLYIKNGYNFVLEKNIGKLLKINNPNIDTNIDNIIDKKFTNIINEIYTIIIQEFKNNFVELYDLNDQKILELIQEYIKQCCGISWVMILQNPILELYPQQWTYMNMNFTDNTSIDEEVTSEERKTDDTDEDTESLNKFKVFSDEAHQRQMGSTKKTSNILYYVWPAISRESTILGDQKINVITQDKFFTKLKVKK